MTSTIKVNTITTESGSTLTLGESGKTVTLASGASQTGFGRTGTVDWQTSIKTSGFTAANGEGYFVNTTSGAITVNLPAGTAGSIVAFRDYANTFDTGNLIVAPNGSQKINNSTVNLTVSTEGESLTLVYADDTKGWLVINDGNNDAGAQAEFIQATGGNITTVCTNFKVHTFTGPGTFCVSSAGNSQGSNSVDYVVIAGGGSGGAGGTGGGGGGAGGYRESPGTTTCYTASPLGTSPATAITVTATAFPIQVGGGGAAPYPAVGNPGNPSTFSTITSAGGGGGGRWNTGGQVTGGSGGGSAQSGCAAGAAGNTPSVNPPQGNPGGGRGHYQMAGGGGATGAGADGNDCGSPAVRPTPQGLGGAAATSSINGTPTARAGGGAGGYANASPAPGGVGKATATGGGSQGGGMGSDATNATDNTGGGGGGNGAPQCAPSGGGGSGIVIIRYKFQ